MFFPFLSSNILSNEIANNELCFDSYYDSLVGVLGFWGFGVLGHSHTMIHPYRHHQRLPMPVPHPHYHHHNRRRLRRHHIHHHHRRHIRHSRWPYTLIHHQNPMLCQNHRKYLNLIFAHSFRCRSILPPAPLSLEALLEVPPELPPAPFVVVPAAPPAVPE